MAKIPMIRSSHGALISFLVFGGLFLAAGSSFFGITAVLWVPLLIFTLGIPALCLTLLTAGYLPALAGFALMGASFYRLLGPGAMGYILFYLAVSVLVFAVLYLKKVKFFKTVTVMAVSQALIQLSIFLLLNHQTQGRLFFEAGQKVSELVKNNQMGDMLLIMLNQMGVLNMSGDLAAQAVLETSSGYVLTEAARNDLLLSLSSLIRTNLEVLVPSLFVTHSLQTAVLSVAFSLHQGKLSHEKWQMRNTPANLNPPVEQLDMPKFSTWHLPKGWGMKIGILGAGYFLALLTDGAPAILGQMLYGVFNVVFTIQGLALINFFQHKKGVRKGWRLALPIIFVLLLPGVLQFMGIFDQVTNIRMLRPLPPEAEEMFREEMRRRQDEMKKHSSEDKHNDDDDDHDGGLV